MPPLPSDEDKTSLTQREHHRRDHSRLHGGHGAPSRYEMIIVDPNDENRGGRARKRAIRARMARTGEPYTIAARRHDAEQQPVAVTLTMPKALCPRCSQGFLVLGEAEPRCIACGAFWENGSSAAGEYAGAVLHLDWYTSITEGGERPAEECPDCAETALVWHTFDPDDGRLGLCFGCGQNFDSRCPRCNRAVLSLDPAGSDLCPECWDEIMERD